MASIEDVSAPSASAAPGKLLRLGGAAAVGEREGRVFTPPVVHFHSGGWGPTTLPSAFLDVPYAPFGKGDRLGRASDFSSRVRNSGSATSSAAAAGGGSGGASGSSDRHSDRADTVLNEALLFRHDGKEDSFHLVGVESGAGTKARARQKGRRPRRPWERRRDRGKDNRRGAPPPRTETPPGGGRKGIKQPRRKRRWRRWRRRDDGPTIIRETSVEVQADWRMVSQFELSQLAKLSLRKPRVRDLRWCGSLAKHDAKYDRVTVKRKRALAKLTRRFFNPTTTDDPIIEELAGELAEPGKTYVFATDELVALLMACGRSVYPFDVVAHRVANFVFFDKREDSDLDLLTVDETAYEPPPLDDGIDGVDALSEEATAINLAFQQQVLKAGSAEEAEDGGCPFYDEEDAAEEKEAGGEGGKPADVLFRYRQYDLSDDIVLVCRTEIHGALMKRGVRQLFTSFALNEYKASTWKRKLDSQRGAIMASQLKNNAFKIARWTARTILAGADLMKIGFVCRKSAKNNAAHEILGTQWYKEDTLARQMNFNLNNAWGVFYMFIQLAMRDEGKIMFVRDGNKPLVRCFAVPEDDEEYDDDDDEEDYDEEDYDEDDYDGGDYDEEGDEEEDEEE